jgi:2-polyprenyl-3-methyl-5-hydroxy-6-metoxy-1,4-benzoquinol methylase
MAPHSSEGIPHPFSHEQFIKYIKQKFKGKITISIFYYEINKKIKNLYKKKKLKCLDFGVGDGRHTEYLLKNSHTVVGTDISQAAINLTKKRLPKFNNLILLNYWFLLSII